MGGSGWGSQAGGTGGTPALPWVAASREDMVTVLLYVLERVTYGVSGGEGSDVVASELVSLVDGVSVPLSPVHHV